MNLSGYRVPGCIPRKLLWIAILLVLGAAARADLVIEINEARRGAIPIAVVPFANETGQALADDPAAIIAANLKRTGDLQPLDKAQMLGLPGRGEEIEFPNWTVLGQRYLLVGTVREQAGMYRVRYELFDVQSRKQIIGREVSGTHKQMRDIAHSISDLVYEALTGIPGVFATRIAYVTLEGRGTNSRYKLEVADADGQRSRLIFSSSQPIMSPAWSPNADRLAYVSFESGRPAIFLQNVSSGTRTRIASYPGLNSAPAWSPDGRKLAMTLSKDGNPEIYVLDLASSNLQRITQHWAIDTEPSWSPEGDQLIFTSDRGGGPQIYQMALDGDKARRLTFSGKYNARPRYSLDGKSLYYVHQRGASFHLARMELADGTVSILTSTGMDEAPSVAPNGAMIIYGTRVQDKGVLAVVGVNSGSKYFLPSVEGDVREPAWSPYLRQ